MKKKRTKKNVYADKTGRAGRAGDTTISQVRYHQSMLPSMLLNKLRWMPKMWLHHHIDFAPQMEHKCSEFQICSLRFEIAACQLLKAPFQPVITPVIAKHIHPPPVNYVNMVN